MKMPSPIQRTFKDLEAIQLIKRNVERIDQLREDFLKESEKYKSEDSFLNEANQEMENLRVEEQALIEEMRQIHSDINALESAKKNAEDVRRHSYQNAKRLLAEMKQLKLDTDDLCKNVQHEALPEQIIDPENEIKFQSSTNPNSHCFSLGAPNPWQLVTGPTFNFTSPILEALQRQK
uniref:Uncharacterized protein n=1 Tax=Romanomermis culicivorax TaxID=13658 RepID=A0A915KKP3_ROMCU